jgi:hypothetical protein
MSDINLHKFKDDLDKVPPKGSNRPPRTIRAKDLDGNFEKVTILPSEAIPPEYEVSYREDGVILSDINGLPAKAEANEFNVCENGNPRTYWFVTWNEKPEIPES